MIEEKSTDTELKRNARRIKSLNKWRKIVPAVLGVLAAVLVMMYVASLLFMKNGTFTVSVKDYGDTRYSLTLCENADFKRKTSRLSVKAVENVNNISVADLPTNLNDTDGSHNGENYLAYTFYLQNSGTESCTYSYKIAITRATLGIDGAARVRVYFNSDYYRASTGEYNYSGAYTDYAKPVTGGNGKAETDIYGNELVNFVNDSVVVENEVTNFAPKSIAKITVVIWLEGDDADCNDDALGGQFKADMSFAVVGGTEE